MRVKHPTSNIEHPTSNGVIARRRVIGCWMLGVGCWVFPRKHRRAGAFTLVELILILAVIALASAIVLPRLAQFFRGRALDSETRQILALMHHGQSRAVSAGVPMVLWIDEKQSAYGLEEEPGYTDKDPDAVEFTLDQQLKFELPQNESPAAMPPATTAASTGPRAELPSIRFLPDGFIAETSPRTLRLVDETGNSVLLTQSRDRSQYEIQAPTN